MADPQNREEGQDYDTKVETCTLERQVCRSERNFRMAPIQMPLGVYNKIQSGCTSNPEGNQKNDISHVCFLTVVEILPN
jgi:hypothetical protein